MPRLYGKAHAGPVTHRLRTQTRAPRDAGIMTPRVAVALHRWNFLAHEPAPGTTFAALRPDPAYASWMEPLAESLSRFQAVDLPDLHRFRLVDEAVSLRRTARWLGRIVPSLAGRIARLSAGVASGLGELEERFAKGHGDFYDDQALVGVGGIALIDLDEIRLAHPLLDAGNMLAHLSSGAMRGDATADAHETFLSASLRQTGEAERAWQNVVRPCRRFAARSSIPADRWIRTWTRRWSGCSRRRRSSGWPESTLVDRTAWR